MFSPDCVCVRQTVEALIAMQKRFKLPTSILTNVFPGQSAHGPWKFFEKGRGQDHVTPKIFRR